MVVRKPLAVSHPKLRTFIGDYDSLPGLDLAADDVFITLGTTKKNTPDPVAYYRVDHDYPVLAAKVAREKGARSVFVVTAVGADPQSRFSYVRTKGETERDLIALDFDHTHIFRPSMLLGSRVEDRPMEKVFLKLWPVIGPLFRGRLDKWRGIEGKDVARAMSNAAKSQTKKISIYQWREMSELV